MTDAEEASFTDRYGVEVFYRRWRVSEPRGSVVIVHGASEHGGRYDRFARALGGAGFEAAAADQRGHGRTARSTGTGRLGAGGGRALVDDIDELVRACEPPVVVFGHSLGSMVTQSYVAATGGRGVAGYILSGPVGVMDGADALAAGMRDAARSGLADEHLDLLGGYNRPFEPARTPYDWLSRDAEEVDRYLADPMCGDGNPLTYGFMADVLEMYIAAVDPSALTGLAGVPVLVIAGDQDPVGGMGVNVRALEARLGAAGAEVTSRHYPDARHELLNEEERDEVTAEIISWLEVATARSRA